jgi:hypothetical protein
MTTPAVKPQQLISKLARGASATTLMGASACLFAMACAGSNAEPNHEDDLRAVIGPSGGELVGAKGSPLEGVRLTIPAGALSADTEISIAPATNLKPLPTTAVGCGPMFEIQPAGLALAAPATLTLPFDEAVVTDHYRFDDEVRVWAVQSDKWGQRQQIDGGEGSVSVELQELNGVGAGVLPVDDEDIVSFDFSPNPKFASCLAQYPNDPDRAPHVQAVVVRGDLNDGLFLRGEYIKPNLAFDMFTVENSALLADGTPNPAFKNFGLAWYQSDLEANDRGRMRASIRTILLDQIFGFDPTVTLPPTGTFQVGFWFNDPDAATACGFDASKPTPFNGEHKAGPLAMITTPDEETGLGPLCTKPDTSVSPAKCSP